MNTVKFITGHPEVDAVGQLFDEIKLSGIALTVVPFAWLEHMDGTAAMLLAQLLYWHRPAEKFDKTGRIVGLEKKFSCDLYFIRPGELECLLSKSPSALTKALVRLEELGVVLREERHQMNGRRGSYRFVRLFPEKIRALTLPVVEDTSASTTAPLGVDADPSLASALTPPCCQGQPLLSVDAKPNTETPSENPSKTTTENEGCAAGAARGGGSGLPSAPKGLLPLGTPPDATPPSAATRASNGLSRNEGRRLEADGAKEASSQETPPPAADTPEVKADKLLRGLQAIEHPAVIDDAARRAATTFFTVSSKTPLLVLGDAMDDDFDYLPAFLSDYKTTCFESAVAYSKLLRRYPHLEGVLSSTFQQELKDGRAVRIKRFTDWFGRAYENRFHAAYVLTVKDRQAIQDGLIEREDLNTWMLLRVLVWAWDAPQADEGKFDPNYCCQFAATPVGFFRHFQKILNSFNTLRPVPDWVQAAALKATSHKPKPAAETAQCDSDGASGKNGGDEPVEAPRTASCSTNAGSPGESDVKSVPASRLGHSPCTEKLTRIPARTATLKEKMSLTRKGQQLVKQTSDEDERPAPSHAVFRCEQQPAESSSQMASTSPHGKPEASPCKPVVQKRSRLKELLAGDTKKVNETATLAQQSTPP